MVILRLRNKEEHKDLLKKVKKMKQYAEMIEDCLEDAMDDDEEYRYRDEDEDEEHYRGGSRYSYRRGGGSRGGRM